MPSSQTSKIGTALILGATILGVGFFTGTKMNKLDSDGALDPTATFYTDAPALAPCTGTGGKANYNTCYWTNPFPVPLIVQNFQLHEYKNPAGAPFDCGPVTSLANSGATVVDNGTTATSGTTSGAIVRSPNDIVIPVGGHFKCVATRDPTAALRAVMLLKFTELHSL